MMWKYYDSDRKKCDRITDKYMPIGIDKYALGI